MSGRLGIILALGRAIYIQDLSSFYTVHKSKGLHNTGISLFVPNAIAGLPSNDVGSLGAE